MRDGDLGDGKGEMKGDGDGDGDGEGDGDADSDDDNDGDNDGDELEEEEGGGGGTRGVVSGAVVGVGALFLTKPGMELVRTEGNDVLFSTTGFQMLSIVEAH